MNCRELPSSGCVQGDAAVPLLKVCKPSYAPRHRAKNGLGQGEFPGLLPLMSLRSSLETGAPTHPHQIRISPGRGKHLNFTGVPLRVLLDPQLEKF